MPGITKTSVEKLYQGVIEGNRTLLSKAITLIESNKESHREKARELVEKCLPHSGNSVRIGITGVPGVGKSTFIEAFGTYLIENKAKKLAVLAIDPSSAKSGGSILGDKTRMSGLSGNDHAFIRPSPSSGSLGGVAKATRETIILCEAAGFDTIFIETVGVGQSEITVSQLVDFFLLLMLAGAGDELQGIKRGIMEMADAIVINKADGDNISQAKTAGREYRNALHLMPPSDSGWQPKVGLTSSTERTGLEDIHHLIRDYTKLTKSNGFFVSKRKAQARYWLHESIKQLIQENIFSNPELKEKLLIMELRVEEGKTSPFKAANELIRLIFN